VNQSFSTPPNEASTPMMKQYLTVKEQHQDCLLFYRMGDFYELFFEDAVTAAADLDIALTKRGKNEGQDIPMCGVPVGSYEVYLAKLIQKGHRVAICEQMESPEQAKERGAKGPLRRDVVRIVTGGTLTEDNLLPAGGYNFLVALSPLNKHPGKLHPNKHQIGVAAIDLSTGYFIVESADLKTLSAVLAKLEPAEIVLPDSLLQNTELFETLGFWKRKLSPLPQARFDLTNAKHRLEQLYKVQTLQSFGEMSDHHYQAAGAVVDYLQITQKQNLTHIQTPRLLQQNNFMVIDAATRRSLELTRAQNVDGSDNKKGSLFSHINKTVTAFGNRLLMQRLSSPLLSVQLINKRLDQVEYFVKNSPARHTVRGILRHCFDLERALTRISMQRGGPRDFYAIVQTLEQSSLLITQPKWVTVEEEPKKDPHPFTAFLNAFDGHQGIYGLLKSFLGDNLPLLARDGGFVKKGYNQELDDLFELRDNGQAKITELQQKYAEQTGINTLKIRHNNVIGYHIDVGPSHVQKVPDYFIHRQTLASSLRYTTVELIDLANGITSAATKISALELKLFEEMREVINAHHQPLSQLAKALAGMDVAAALADLAVDQNYTRPILDESLNFKLIQARHPVVEQTAKQHNNSGTNFVANDTEFHDGRKLLLITGPNMAGKSTYLRQNALVAIMAQMGSFVPAQFAHIGIVERIFSRVGAADDLASGQSTFMVEMVETATILNQATSRSLVILDEIGRGTATYDGLAIAWAVTEALHNENKSRTLFATHYHELTKLKESLANLNCLTVKIREDQGRIVFLHKVIEGCADKSYGIHVAALAGLPESVVSRAASLLEGFENGRF